MSRVPLEIETAFLGGLIRRPSDIDDVRDEVRVEDLGSAAHQDLYSLLIAMRDRRDHIELTTVCDAVSRLERKTCDNPMVWIGDVYAAGGMAPAYVSRLIEASLNRGLAIVVGEAARRVESPDGPVEERMNAISDDLAKLANRLPGVESVSIAEVTNQTLDAIDARMRGEQTAGLRTGFLSLDDVLCGGLPVGGLTIVGARPSVGKTSFCISIMRAVCARGGCVFFASLEQRAQEIDERILAGESRVSIQAIRTGSLSSEEVNRITEAAGRVRRWKMHISDRSGVRVGRIASAARHARRKMGGLDLIVVDYLTLIRGDNERANRNEQVGQAAERLRGLAKDMDVPLLLCAQLNRMAANEAPALHHLRDSGEIEQHADVVMFLHRPGEPGQSPDPIDLIVRKQRNGPLATVEYDHHARFFNFEERVGIPL